MGQGVVVTMCDGGHSTLRHRSHRFTTRYYMPLKAVESRQDEPALLCGGCSCPSCLACATKGRGRRWRNGSSVIGDPYGVVCRRIGPSCRFPTTATRRLVEMTGACESHHISGLSPDLSDFCQIDLFWMEACTES